MTPDLLAVPPPAAVTGPARDSTVRVFMVDDEPSIATALQMVFAIEPDIQSEYCPNPFEAAAAAERFKPTVILLDLLMPAMDGLTLLREMRTMTSLKDVPVIVLSGEDEPEVKREAFELGANDYLVKLPSRVEIVARIRAHASAYMNKLQRDEAYAALQSANQRLAEALELVKVEQEKSERLLLNVLPKPIADRLKLGDTTIADSFPDVTVLFADVVGFTELSNLLPAAEVVRMLNEIFSRFDHLAAGLGLEKIKTIGDAYMAVGGVPTPMEDHAGAAAELALRMHEEIECFNEERGAAIRLRIGLNTGPVIAGVIGQRKFIYDLWGDTVNIASRMESQGEPGSIQVTESTFERIRGKFHCAPRGPIEIKGKGQMNVHWLKGRGLAIAVA